jgi:hypothetical protein
MTMTMPAPSPAMLAHAEQRPPPQPMETVAVAAARYVRLRNVVPAAARQQRCHCDGRRFRARRC